MNPKPVRVEKPRGTDGTADTLGFHIVASKLAHLETPFREQCHSPALTHWGERQRLKARAWTGEWAETQQSQAFVMEPLLPRLFATPWWPPHGSKELPAGRQRPLVRGGNLVPCEGQGPPRTLGAEGSSPRPPRPAPGPRAWPAGGARLRLIMATDPAPWATLRVSSRPRPWVALSSGPPEAPGSRPCWKLLVQP